MAIVRLTWTTAKVNVPANTDLVQYVASIDGVGETLVGFGDVLNAEFKDVKPGNYIARVALTDVGVSHRDFEKSVEFNVPEQTVELNAPDVITVEVS
jgi:hypothetical protein